LKQTRSQQRAVNALNAAQIPGMGHGQDGGNALSGFPMLIKTDGALAAFAFAVERKPNSERKQSGAYLIVGAIATHLHALGIGDATTADDLVDELARGDSALLRRATVEALAFLNYLKRFVA
jgi:CRISPR/Cas system CMR-associated protein Cmr5 small subunit